MTKQEARQILASWLESSKGTEQEAIKKLQKQKAEYLDEWVDYSGVAEAFDRTVRLH